MLRPNTYFLFFGGIVFSLLTWFTAYKPATVLLPNAQEIYYLPPDTIDSIRNSRLGRSRPTFKGRDRYGDPFSNSTGKSRLLGDNPSNLKLDVEFNPDSGNYTITEKIGELDYRPPTLMDPKELEQYQKRNASKNFWRNRSEGLQAQSPVGGRGLIPKIPLGNRFLGRIFGGDYVEFKPTGFANLDFGLRTQKIANPAIPVRQQKSTIFDFDPHVNLNLVGQVGEKLKIMTSFDTKAAFDFENNFKVEYTGFEEEIIQKIEFGNINFALPTTLIQGSQNLFGIKSELRFGRLRVNSVFSNQRARADEVSVQGGAQVRKFEIKASDYEENRHFFLSHFFRNKYEAALAKLPVILSGVTITRVEAYITNRTNNTQTLRNITGLMDLGEANPHKPNLPVIQPVNVVSQASNAANGLFQNLINNPAVRNADNTAQTLEGNNLKKGEDFEVIRGSRRLTDQEFTFQPELGYISLNTPLRNDEVLAVAFEYTLGGKTFRVGELTEDYQNFPVDQVIILKLLRPSSIRTDLPMWNLMMKNIYSLNASQLVRENFQFRIIYKDDATGIDNPSLQEGQNTKDVPLVQLFGMDKLNQKNDPQRDGNFDYVEGITVDSRNGRVIFPILEPFGSYLEKKFNAVTELDLINKYAFPTLYKSTKADAQQIANKNKFFLKGSFQGSASNDVALPGINIAQGSVTVTAGGTLLVEGQDYQVDYNTGRVTVINEAILSSGKEIKINFEKSDFFNLQTRTLTGSRFDYQLAKDINLGATVMNLKERPVLTRVNIGQEAVNNTIWGTDLSLKKTSRFLTRLVDLLPLVQTKEVSNIDFNSEFAQLRPGASKRSGAISYIDDFEGTEIPYDLTRTPNVRWRLGATPQIFYQGNINDPLAYTYKRAKLSWYNIDNVFYRTGGGSVKPNNISDVDLENHYVRAIVPQEIFPNRQFTNIPTNEVTMDLAYFPTERGPYNYNPDLDANGKLKNPKESWAGITRAITTEVDFDNANIEYIEFWLLDPFLSGDRGKVIDGVNNTNNTTGGDLYFNLGSVSEDIMKDGRHFFENGLPITGATDNNTDVTTWGRVPRQQYLNNAFDNTAGTRPNQDVGYDGLRNEEEIGFFQQNFLDLLPAAAKDKIIADPSGDNFRYYLDASFDNQNSKIIERYKDFNNPDGNTPEDPGTGTFVPSSSNLPDNEDLNTDNTLSDLEEYYQYRVPLKPGGLVIGQNFIVDKVTAKIGTSQEDVSWYQFRIPVREFADKIGNINGFKSIRFMRMFVTNFEQPVVLRMAQFQLVANQWRRYTGDLTEADFQQPNEPYDPFFTISTVNIEENGKPDPNSGDIPYDLPPGGIRDKDITSINGRELNEQSIQLCVRDLKDKDARAVFKNVGLDFINYKRLNMYIHAQSDNAKDGEVAAFIRIGTDFTENYYEIEVPLKIVQPSEVVGEREARQRAIWPVENQLDVALEELVNTKVERNAQGLKNKFIPYSRQVGQYKITVVGNPDMSTVLLMMLGIRNPHLSADDQQPKAACVWFDELRMTGFDKTAGWAALSRINLKLADFANISASGKYTTYGFGTINQKISERTRFNTLQYDISSTIALDKFIPEKVGMRIPMFMSFERTNASPHFNPLDPDVPLTKSLSAFQTDAERQNYKDIIEDNMTRRSLNFTNVRKVKTNPSAKNHFWDIENFAATWAYDETKRSNITTESYLAKHWYGSLGYTYTNQPKVWEPFKNVKILDSPYLKLIKDFNLMLGLTSISIKGELDRKYIRTQLRGADLTTNGVDPLFEKYFTFNRIYDLRWSITKSLSIGYSAIANSIIDEPYGDINSQVNKDSVWSSLKQLGRMKNFTQRASANYKLPLDKLPLTDWITADVTYEAGYNWAAGSVGIADTMGNTLQNSRNRQLNGGLDLVKLYNKVKFLKAINSPPPPKKPPLKKELSAVKDTTKTRQKDYKLIKGILRPIMSLRNINFTYALQEQTLLPGFLPKPRFFGLDSTFTKPGWDFVLGSQDPSIRQKAANNGWLASSTALNTQFGQGVVENFNLRTGLEPFKDFKIQVDASFTRTSNYEELFRFNPDNQRFETQSPVKTGSLTMSYIAVQTFFNKDSKDNISSTFTNFANNRQIIRNRLKGINGNPGDYGLNSQDVLIPAFLAAYTNKDPNATNLSPFPSIPLPNWRIDYTGLSRLKIIKDVFANFTISHSYVSNYNVASYTSSLQYGSQDVRPQDDERKYLLPNQLNTEGQYVSVLVISQINITERFAPLVGVNFKTKKNWTFKVDYNQERNLGLNLSNAQLTELKSRDLILGIGYTKANLKLPFKSNGKKIILKNDVTFRCDVGIRDTKTLQRKLDAENTVTAGNLNFQLKPNVTYMVDQRLNIQVYFEKNINSPYVLNSFPTTNTVAGVQLRYNLAQ